MTHARASQRNVCKLRGTMKLDSAFDTRCQPVRSHCGSQVFLGCVSRHINSMSIWTAQQVLRLAYNMKPHVCLIRLFPFSTRSCSSLCQKRVLVRLGRNTLPSIIYKRREAEHRSFLVDRAQLSSHRHQVRLSYFSIHTISHSDLRKMKLVPTAASPLLAYSSLGLLFLLVPRVTSEVCCRDTIASTTLDLADSEL